MRAVDLFERRRISMLATLHQLEVDRSHVPDSLDGRAGTGGCPAAGGAEVIFGA
jgi:hypothetical protein